LVCLFLLVSLNLTCVGVWAHEATVSNLSGMTMALYTRALGWSTEEVEVFLTDVRKDMKNPRIHSYWPMCVLQPSILLSSKLNRPIKSHPQAPRFVRCVCDVLIDVPVMLSTERSPSKLSLIKELKCPSSAFLKAYTTFLPILPRVCRLKFTARPRWQLT
jgi:hypothetical protein